MGLFLADRRRSLGALIADWNGDQRLRIRLPSDVFVAVFLASCCAVQLPMVAAIGLGAWSVALAGAGLLVMAAIQVGYFGRRRAGRLRDRRTPWFLGIQAVLGCLPLLLFGQAWMGLACFTVAGVLLVLRPPVAWPVVGAVLLGMAGVQALLDGRLLDILYAPLSVGLGGIELFVLTWLSMLATEMYETRGDLAERAVVAERLRFTRDLDDLLGLTLSRLTLRGELAIRLVTSVPVRARMELATIARSTRSALQDVRAMAAGYRDLSVRGESRIVESVLNASEVDVELSLELDELSPPVRTAVTGVLRASAVEALRRSDVTRCEVRLRQVGERVRLDVTADGRAPGHPARDDQLAASGVTVRGLGGQFEARTGTDGEFGVHAELPVGATGEDDGTAELSVRLGGRMADVVRVLLLGGMALGAALQMFYRDTAVPSLVVGLACVAVLFVLQVGWVSRPGAELRSVRGYLLFAAQACLVYLPLLFAGANWSSLPRFLAGTALLVFPAVLGCAVFAVVVASVVSIEILGGVATSEILFSATSVVIGGVVIFGVTWLTRVFGQLDLARTRLAETVVMEERLRFSRDLHDLLGLSLSAIALKSELAEKLVMVDRARATREVREILDLARRALAEVRSVTGGPHELSLESETRSVQATLAAAGVEVAMDMRHGPLPTAISTVFAFVLREGATNVLRHSTAVRRCDITMNHRGDTLLLDIVNDGAVFTGTADRTGNGIRNLSYRVDRLGGRLTARSIAEDRFRLRVVMPVPALEPAPAPGEHRGQSARWDIGCAEHGPTQYVT